MLCLRRSDFVTWFREKKTSNVDLFLTRQAVFQLTFSGVYHVGPWYGGGGGGGGSGKGIFVIGHLCGL